MAQTTLPDYHFLLIDPHLGAEWFFDAARQYWERFRPTVISDLAFLRFIPEGASVVITAVVRRDSVAQIGVEVAQAAPTALFDPVTEDTFEAMRARLNERAALNQPFGVPLANVPGGRIDVTPGSLIGSPVPTREPGGFVTQTPTPASPGVVPTQPADVTPRAPIEPTPGSLIG